MPVKVYKRSNTARSIAYQDALLAPKVPGWPDIPMFIDSDDLINLLRPSTRKQKIDLYTASIALIGDDEEEFRAAIHDIAFHDINLVCIEEDVTWVRPVNIERAVKAWKAARKAGAAKRGAEMSAASKKAKTAAALALIEEDLKRNDYTTRELLDRVGVKSVNSIKNHYGITREQMQIRYEAAQKRKQRREEYANR